MTDFAARRLMMVDTQIRPSDVTKYPIIDAMLDVPRERFVPDGQTEAAYAGENVAIGRDRVLLEPRTLAKMLDALDVRDDELVLDIGCGYGYSAAVLSHMAEAVVAVEEDETLVGEAQGLLTDVGADNVALHQGPLAAGADELGPFDVIIIQGGVETVPDALMDQLKDGGRIACLFIEGELGAVRIGIKHAGRMNWRFEFNAGAPILPGFVAERAFAL